MAPWLRNAFDELGANLNAPSVEALSYATVEALWSGWSKATRRLEGGLAPSAGAVLPLVDAIRSIAGWNRSVRAVLMPEGLIRVGGVSGRATAVLPAAEILDFAMKSRNPLTILRRLLRCTKCRKFFLRGRGDVAGQVAFCRSECAAAAAATPAARARARLDERKRQAAARDREARGTRCPRTRGTPE